MGLLTVGARSCLWLFWLFGGPCSSYWFASSSLNMRRLPNFIVIWHAMFGWYPWVVCPLLKGNWGGVDLRERGSAGETTGRRGEGNSSQDVIYERGINFNFLKVGSWNHLPDKEKCWGKSSHQIHSGSYMLIRKMTSTISVSAELKPCEYLRMNQLLPRPLGQFNKGLLLWTTSFKVPYDEYMEVGLL